MQDRSLGGTWHKLNELMTDKGENLNATLDLVRCKNASLRVWAAQVRDDAALVCQLLDLIDRASSPLAREVHATLTQAVCRLQLHAKQGERL